MEQIAVKADVGIGTLYRRFPVRKISLMPVTDLAKERTIKNRPRSPAAVAPGDALSEFLRRCIAAPSCLAGDHDPSTVE